MLLNKLFFNLFFLFATTPVWAAGITEEVLVDLISNFDQSVNVGSSNTKNCEIKKDCTIKLKDYLALHQLSLAKEVSEARLAKINTELSKLRISGSCSDWGAMNGAYSEFLKESKIQLPPKNKQVICDLRFSFERGEINWSENLRYLKTKKLGVIENSFWAYGSP